VSLLSSEPRGIKNVTEYYQISPAAPASGASSSDGGVNNNAPNISTGWSSVKPDLNQGQTLWNFEVIEYSASDAEGKNRYSWTSPSIVAYMARDGKDALAALTLSLSNDLDLIPANSEGIVESTALGGATTKVKAYKYGIEESGNISCSVKANTSSGEVTVNSSYYSFSNNEFKLLSWNNDSKWNSVVATFSYTATIEGKTTVAERAFVMNRMDAEPGKDPIDYYLEILPNSKNTSTSDGSVTIRAKKQEGSAITDISGTSGVVVKYGNTTMSGNTTNGYIYPYSKNQEGEIDFMLYIDGTLWDNETLLLVKNGADGGNLEIQYQNATSSSELIENDWEDSIPAIEPGKKTFMR
jgi:hypothetical protein